jgi:hypothetical protein
MASRKGAVTRALEFFGNNGFRDRVAVATIARLRASNGTFHLTNYGHDNAAPERPIAGTPDHSAF